MASYAQQNKVTHAGVAVNNWAGDFECSVCRRKRLTASEFSKKMQERYKKDGNGALKCKVCVDKAAADERAAAVAKTQAAAPSSTTDTATCAACKENLPVSAFTKPQLKKGPAKQRCQPCIAKAEADEQASGKAKKEETLKAAREAVAKAEKSGDAAAKLRANATLSALEGELVTGLRPLKIGRGRSRGRGRGRRGK